MLGRRSRLGEECPFWMDTGGEAGYSPSFFPVLPHSHPVPTLLLLPTLPVLSPPSLQSKPPEHLGGSSQMGCGCRSVLGVVPLPEHGSGH